MIYAVEAVGTGFIKFGFAKDMRGRLSSLQIGSPFELKVLVVCEGARAEERRIHSMLTNVHHRGEWFRKGEETDRAVALMMSKAAKMPRLADARHLKRQRATDENRQSGGWAVERKRREDRGERGKISTAQALSLAHAREAIRKSGGRFAPSIAAARRAAMANPPQCGNSEFPNGISERIPPTPM